MVGGEGEEEGGEGDELEGGVLVARGWWPPPFLRPPRALPGRLLPTSSPVSQRYTFFTLLVVPKPSR